MKIFIIQILLFLIIYIGLRIVGGSIPFNDFLPDYLWGFWAGMLTVWVYHLIEEKYDRR